MACKRLRFLGLALLLVLLLTVVAGCRTEEEVTVITVGPKGDLATQVVSPKLTIGESVSAIGLLEDTGALTLLTSYNWDESGITHTVYFLEPRLPELDGRLVDLTGATVTETDIYGYGIGLSGGSTTMVEAPSFALPEELGEQLANLDLDKLSKHPEHNGDYRPDTAAVTNLHWTAVDCESGETLYQATPLFLPPFDDPRLTRWLQAYALVNDAGEPIRFYVGVQGSFAE